MSNCALHKVYYFTDAFPFGTGEKPFVTPELYRLSSSFEVTVVSLAPIVDMPLEEAACFLPEGVGLLHIQPVSRLRSLLYATCYPFSRMGRQEIARIMASGKHRIARIAAAGAYYGHSRALLRLLRKSDLFRDADSSMYYTFWFNEALLACALQKQEEPSLRIASRIHGYDLYKERAPLEWQCFHPFKMEAADRVLFLTEKARSYFEDNYVTGSSRDDFLRKTDVCPLGCPAAQQTEAQEEEGDFLLVSCSNAIPLKRVDLIIEALARLEGPKVRWVHFGGGSDLERLRLFAEQKGVAADFRGYTPHDEVLDFYAANHAGCFITVSSSEGLPVSIQEAMAYGIPIIGTDVGSISEEIDGNGVLLAASPTPEEVARAIGNVRDASQEEASRMRKRSLELWQASFDQEKCLESLQAMFEGLAA